MRVLHNASYNGQNVAQVLYPQSDEICFEQGEQILMRVTSDGSAYSKGKCLGRFALNKHHHWIFNFASLSGCIATKCADLIVAERVVFGNLIATNQIFLKD